MLAGMSYLTQQTGHMNVAAHVPLWQTAANSNMFVLTGGDHVWNNMTRLHLWFVCLLHHTSASYIYSTFASQPQGVTQLLSTTRYVVCSLTDVALCSVSISCTLQHLLWLCDARQHDSTGLLVGLLNLEKSTRVGWHIMTGTCIQTSHTCYLYLHHACQSKAGPAQVCHRLLLTYWVHYKLGEHCMKVWWGWVTLSACQSMVGPVQVYHEVLLAHWTVSQLGRELYKDRWTWVAYNDWWLCATDCFLHTALTFSSSQQLHKGQLGWVPPKLCCQKTRYSPYVSWADAMHFTQEHSAWWT